MRKSLTTLALALSGVFGTISAQQDPQFTQFMHNKLSYNPAYAGTNGAYCGTVMGRNQWTGFTGAPMTGLINVDGLFLNRIGAGLNVIKDKIGNENTMMARLALSYVHEFRDDDDNPTGQKLSGGLDFGVLQKKIDGTWIPPQTMNDPSIPSNTTTGSPVFNKLSPDFGFGLYYTTPKMYVGLSATHITAADLKGAAASGYSLNYQMARHYYVIAGYNFALSNPDNQLTPHVKVKSDGKVTQLDLNLTYTHSNMFWVGATYRMQDAIAPMFGYINGGFKAGYSYDLTLSKIRNYSSGTHEIMLSYCYRPVKTKHIESHGSVRFLEP